MPIPICLYLMVKTIDFRFSDVPFNVNPLMSPIQEWLGSGRLRGQLQWLCSLNRWGWDAAIAAIAPKGMLMTWWNFWWNFWWNTGEIMVMMHYDGEIHRSTQPCPCEIVGLWLILLCLPGYHITLKRCSKDSRSKRRTQIGTSKTDSKKERVKAMKTCWFTQKLIPEVCRCHLCWSMGRRSIGEEIQHILQWWGIPT